MVTKLEEKLEELGYVYNAYNKNYIKIHKDFWEFTIVIGETSIDGFITSSTETDVCIECQNDVDYFQNLYDLLKQDLEELRKYEIRD